MSGSVTMSGPRSPSAKLSAFPFIERFGHTWILAHGVRVIPVCSWLIDLVKVRNGP